MEIRAMSRSEAPLISGIVVLDAGETPVPGDRAGLAVLTGDALSGGTRTHSATELAEALEGLGVSLRVATGWDATTVGFTCVAERLDRTLDLVAEVVRSPSFPEDEVDRIRRQQLAVIRQRRMEPGPFASEELDRAIFPSSHPYHRPLTGTAEAVEGLDASAARSLVEERYRAAGAGFVLVGDLTPEEVGRAAERHFGDWSGTAPERPHVPVVDSKGELPVVVVHREAAVQSEIRIGLPGPGRGGPDDSALEVGNAVLGGAFTSRLNLNLRERHGFTYGVRSRFSQRRRGGRFSIATSVQTEVTAAALGEALKEFRRFVSEGPTQGEVVQARDYLAGVFPLRMETVAQLAGRTAELLVYDLPPDHHHHYRDRIRDVTAEEAREAMARHLDPEGARVVIVGDAEQVRGPLEEMTSGPVEVREG
jgi:zinc protease